MLADDRLLPENVKAVFIIIPDTQWVLKKILLKE